MEKWKIFVLVIVTLAVTGIMVLKFTGSYQEIETPKAGEFTVVEVGSNVCIPCKLLVPVFDEMRADFGDKVTIHKYEKTTEAEKTFNISIIPTIIIYDDKATEITRKIVTEQDAPGVRDWIVETLSSVGCEVE